MGQSRGVRLKHGAEERGGVTSYLLYIMGYDVTHHVLLLSDYSRIFIAGTVNDGAHHVYL